MAEIIKTFTDLTDLQITDVKKALETRAKEEDLFGYFSEDRKWEKGVTALEYKRLVIDPVHKNEVKPLVEGVAPDPTKLTYATFRVQVEDYADYINYTDKSKKYLFNDVTKDSMTRLAHIKAEKNNYVNGRPLYNSRCSITAPATINADNLINLFGKAKIILKKNKAKPITNGLFAAVITPEVELYLLMHLRQVIDHTSENNAIIKGNIGKFAGFDLVSLTTELADTATGKQTIAFVGRTPFGEKPLLRFIPETEIFNNGLGTGLVKNAAGELVADAAHQVGSVAYKDMGMAATILDDKAVLNCTLTVEQIGGSDLTIDGRTDYVSHSTTPKAPTTGA